MQVSKALVTGASEGIGQVIAERLAAEGHQVTVVARSEKSLKDLVDKLGPNHKYIVADLSNANGIKAVSDALTKEKFNILVNNAGAGVYGTFEKISLEKQLGIVSLNVDAVVALSHAFLAQATEGDSLVNVASVLGLTGFPFGSVYAATKAFVINFSESLWVEGKNRGVYVMALCPGATSTRFHVTAGGNEKTSPPKHIMQTPEQVADECMAALKKRRTPVVISGRQNRAQGFVTTRILSRKSKVSLMGKFSAQMRT